MMDRASFTSAYQQVTVDHVYREKGGVGAYALPAFLAEPGIDHGFSSRVGGVSRPPFSGLNLSFTNDDRAAVMENYRRFCQGMGIPEASMVMDSYEHGVTVL